MGGEMSIFRRLSVYFLLALVLAQCGRKHDFLYRMVEGKPDAVIQSAKIKEMHGISRIDVLWVIDNSGSMMTHQKNVIDNTKYFMNAFTSKKALDWKMGLLSTHQGDAPYIGFKPKDILDHTTKDPVGKFQDAVKGLGWNQGCPELVFEPVMDAFTKYPGFSRKNSVLAIMALTDTMEEGPTLKGQFEKALKAEKGNMKLVKFYGTFAGESFGCRGELPWKYPGSPFEYFVKLTKSKSFSLCAPDFGKNLALVAEDMVSSVVHSKVTLKDRPQVESLQVFYKGDTLPGGSPDSGSKWYYDFDLNAVSFYDLDFAEDENSSVEVYYEKAK